MSTPSERLDEALDGINLCRQHLQDLYIPVLKNFPKGSPEREDFIALKVSVDIALMDLENAALGSIAARMAEALPDVESAEQKLSKRVKKLSQLQDSAKKLTKVLDTLTKVVALLT